MYLTHHVLGMQAISSGTLMQKIRNTASKEAEIIHCQGNPSAQVRDNGGIIVLPQNVLRGRVKASNLHVTLYCASPSQITSSEKNQFQEPRHISVIAPKSHRKCDDLLLFKTNVKLSDTPIVTRMIIATCAPLAFRQR